MPNYVIDTSVVIEKIVSKLIIKGEIKGKILIPKAVVAELEAQANRGQETGLIGLDELQNLQKLKGEGKIELDFIGDRPNLFQIRMAKRGGEIDALIRDLAYKEDATLITADKIQAESAMAFGLKVKLIETKRPKEKLEIEGYFDENTMSIHIKEGCYVYGKKGSPGNWVLTKISDAKLDHYKVKGMAKDIVEKSRMDPDAFIEISRQGSTIVQYKNYRIVIVKKPVADGWEITVVKPVKKLKLSDYSLPEQILKNLKERARGIVVAGAVGSGKSTFSSALAETYLNIGKIVKTVESPRDLVLPDDTTQYSKNFTTSEEIHDILFLSRPDNIIFDEMRDTPDFKLYVDLRLAGSNCLGVLHAATPIDAVQRFIGRIEAGMIPSVLDTIIFMESGKIGNVLSVKMIVKVPTGMIEADLARPVVEVRDFLTNKLEFEIYSYGEETVVVPVGNEKSVPARNLASKFVENEMRNYVSEVKVEVIGDNKAVVYVPAGEIGRLIGKEGKNIEAIEKKIGISIDVEELKGENGNVDFEFSDRGKYLIFYIKPSISVDFYVNGQFLFTSTSSKKGEIKINRKSKLGITLDSAVKNRKNVELKRNV